MPKSLLHEQQPLQKNSSGGLVVAAFERVLCELPHILGSQYVRHFGELAASGAPAHTYFLLTDETIVSSLRAVIHSIYRYPVKGLSPQAITRTKLIDAEAITGDRIYAIENGPSGFDARTPAHVPKTRFLNLMQNERLATLATEFDETSHLLTVRFHGDEVASGKLRTAEGRAAIEEFLARYCAQELRGPPRIVSAPGHSFSDVGHNVVSVINLASVSDIEKVVGTTVDPLRFRGNIYVRGWPPWHEFDLMGREIGIGPARIKVVARIDRCAATDVDPASGIRNLNIPKTLMHTFGTVDCGVYAAVMMGGEIARGDDLAEIFPR